MEIAPGVYQFGLPIPNNPLVPDSTLGEAFVYLVETEHGFVLVDAGWNDQDALDELLRNLDDKGISLDSIRWIVLTHYHPDHFGLAERLRALTGAKVAMHYLDLPDSIRGHYLSEPDAGTEWMRQWRIRQGMTQAEAGEIPSPEKGIDIFLPPIKVDVRLRGGETLDNGAASLEAMWTPGHTPGHICLYDRRRKALFSGDQVLPKITPHISVHPHTQGDPLGDYLASLDKLDGLQVSLVLPGHEYSFSNLQRRTAEIRRHHEIRTEETLDALKEGPRTSYDVASCLHWATCAWPEMTPFTRQLAMFETLAHLRHMQHMQHRGHVRMFKADGVDLYEKV